EEQGQHSCDEGGGFPVDIVIESDDDKDGIEESEPFFPFLPAGFFDQVHYLKGTFEMDECKDEEDTDENGPLAGFGNGPFAMEGCILQSVFVTGNAKAVIIRLGFEHD